MSIDHQHWPMVQQMPVLQQDEVHLWALSTELSDSLHDDLWATLDASEQARAQRFSLPHVRRRYVVVRGVLRSMLGRYLSCPPEQLRFCYGSWGKPALVADSGSASLQFNVSHCRDLALFILSRSHSVGVDVEFICHRQQQMAIAKRFFSDEEWQYLAQLEGQQQNAEFYRIWCIKEAYIKALGSGLQHGLDTFSVPLQQADGHIYHPQTSAWWQAHTIMGLSGFAAAWVVAAQQCHHALWTWNPSLLRKESTKIN